MKMKMKNSRRKFEKHEKNCFPIFSQQRKKDFSRENLKRKHGNATFVN